MSILSYGLIEFQTPSCVNYVNELVTKSYVNVQFLFVCLQATKLPICSYNHLLISAHFESSAGQHFGEQAEPLFFFPLCTRATRPHRVLAITKQNRIVSGQSVPRLFFLRWVAATIRWAMSTATLTHQPTSLPLYGWLNLGWSWSHITMEFNIHNLQNLFFYFICTFQMNPFDVVDEHQESKNTLAIILFNGNRMIWLL